MKQVVMVAIVVLLSAIGVFRPPTAGAQTGSTMSQAPSGRSETDTPVLAKPLMAQVSGDVSSVDPQSGKLTVDTPDGPLTATFPPTAVQDVKKGDHVTVVIGLAVVNSPAASPRTSGSPTSPQSSGSSGPGRAPAGPRK